MTAETTTPTTATTWPAAKPPWEPFTAADLLDTPDDGRRYEVLEGALVVSPSPRFRHQRCVVDVEDALRLGAPAGYSTYAGGNVDAGEDAPIPDVLVVSDRVLTEDLSFAAPADVLVVVEVLSPGQAARDRLLKRSIYARMGIGVYWIVDPSDGTAQVLRLRRADGEAGYVDAYVGTDLAEAARVTWSTTG